MVSWTAMISGYSKKYTFQAWSLFVIDKPSFHGMQCFWDTVKTELLSWLISLNSPEKKTKLNPIRQLSWLSGFSN